MQSGENFGPVRSSQVYSEKKGMMAHLLPLTGQGVDQLENGRAAHGPSPSCLSSIGAVGS
jgi:hypothetical protein